MWIFKKTWSWSLLSLGYGEDGNQSCGQQGNYRMASQRTQRPAFGSAATIIPRYCTRQLNVGCSSRRFLMVERVRPLLPWRRFGWVQGLRVMQPRVSQACSNVGDYGHRVISCKQRPGLESLAASRTLVAGEYMMNNAKSRVTHRWEAQRTRY